MKKLMKILCSFVIAICLLFGFTTTSAQASAAGATNVEFLSTANAVITDFSKFTGRFAGTKAEKNASEYISQFLNSETELSPKSNSYIEGGIQNFTFESDFSGKYENSQNIIYLLDNAKTDKKVILGCHYDAVAYKLSEETGEFEEIETEAINGSAASVAFLLTLAKTLPALNLDFDVEIVFFGAGESSQVGSKVYTRGISEEDRKNILCMINFDGIALGEDVYYYVDEVETKLSKFIGSVVEENKSKVKQVKTSNLSKTILYEPNELGLTYSHIALTSDNVQFMKEKINTINVFAGDYDSGIVVGRNEFDGKDVLTYTENDTIKYITEKVGLEKINQNLTETYSIISDILTDFDLVGACEATQGSEFVYAVFANQKLAVYLTAVAFVVFVGVAMFIYHKLNLKSYYARIEPEFLSSVVKITESIDENGIDVNVAKVVSRVIAKDIKKDKIIKVKRNKKDNDLQD